MPPSKATSIRFRNLKTPARPNLRRADGRSMAKFHLAGMNHGLYFASRGMIALPTATTDSDMKEIVERTDRAMADVANEP